MRYNKYTIKTVTEAEDVISASLDSLGIEGVQIEDNIPLTEDEKARMFVDILPGGLADDGIAYISFFLDADSDNSEMLDRVRDELEDLKTYMDAGECSITETTLADTDYLNNWKQYFHQFYIDDILFIPSWEELEEPADADMVIHIDPGTAFGTGMHETTKLCIKALRRYVNPGMKLLDVGTGSGILAMMAYKFGVSYAVGTDLDPCTIEAVRDNMERNGLKDKGFELIMGNIIDDKAVRDKVGYDKYDIVTANILAEVLTELTPVIVDHMKKGAYFITSGIIKEKEELVADSLKKNGFTIEEIGHLGEWTGIVARKDR